MRIADLIKKEEPSITTNVAAAPPPAAPSLPVLITELPLPDIEVQNRNEGVALTINNLNFRPDSAELLASETPRLEALAKALLTLPERSFLIAGHSAATGRPEGEKQLSVDRAQAIAEALQKHGIPADKLVYEGRGSTVPVAANTTEEGRARNRRVEIIILD